MNNIYDKINLVKGDITEYPADVIVNAANTSLLGGSGVDSVIHRKGGKAILEDCQKIRTAQGGCKTGEAVITTAGKLPFKYIIHTVGPVWKNGKSNEQSLLENSYNSSLKLAQEYGLKEISFPNISTGIYRFPKEAAAKIAIGTVKKYLEENENSLTKVNFVCFEEENFKIYKNLIKKFIERN